MKIIDDTDKVHGELDLFIKPGKATVTAKPKEIRIKTKSHYVPETQDLKENCSEVSIETTTSSSLTEISKRVSLKVPRKSKATALATLSHKAENAADDTKKSIK